MIRKLAAAAFAFGGGLVCACAAMAGDPAAANTGAATEVATVPQMTAPVPAPVPAPLADSDGWRFQAATYGWLMSVSGSTTTHGQTVDTNASFIDLMQKSDSLIGFMAYLEADKGPVGVYADFVFTKMGFTTSQAAYRNPIAGLKLSATANAALTMQMFVMEVGGVYELARWNGGSGNATTLEAVGGFRYWNVNLAGTFDALITANTTRFNLSRSAGFALADSGTTQWVDPLVGLRLRHQLAPNQMITLRGDIGGFNLANSLSWQALAVYSYDWQFTGYQIAALLGFRALGVNYNTGSGATAFGLNEVFYGPVVGATVRF
ncbi:hypothetical protein KQ910_12545 [Reyranella sp. MMS21-HV4-11]|uniref:Outer membrane beta-barrel porin/alpha-amylase n=1 Tax=Reyranella humidisoli TaxID=2849149 RepID=A0ABS6IKR5_9HYPH|nr:hypothetical protein [Reyranella sp. MMS21-HV4-11]MBU8874595.1 hypothetical protein [Reyranella sp. MMS21-HV4-11]